MDALPALDAQCMPCTCSTPHILHPHIPYIPPCPYVHRVFGPLPVMSLSQGAAVQEAPTPWLQAATRCGSFLPILHALHNWCMLFMSMVDMPYAPLRCPTDLCEGIVVPQGSWEGAAYRLSAERVQAID